MAKKYLDLDGLSHFKSKLDTEYVEQVSGKGLSSNDYTDTEKTKLAGIDSGAEVNVIESITVNGITATVSGKSASVTIPTGDGAISQISVNGVAQTVTQGAVDISVPTQVSDLTDGANVVKDANYVHTDVNFTSAKDTKLSGIATGAQVNKIETIKVNGTTQTITSKAVDISVPTNTNQLTNGAGFITGISSGDVTSALGYTPYNSTNPSGYQTASEVSTAISSALSSTYKPKGSVAFANLPALSSANEGNVYNVTDAFTTTSDFVEGAGNSYPAGTNVVIVNTSGSTYKYDVLAGFVDLSAYQLSSDLVAITNAEINALFS